MHYTGWLGPCYKWFVSCLNGLGSSGLMASSSRPRTCTPQGIVSSIQGFIKKRRQRSSLMFWPAILHQDQLKNRLNCTRLFNSFLCKSAYSSNRPGQELKHFCPQSSRDVLSLLFFINIFFSYHLEPESESIKTTTIARI